MLLGCYGKNYPGQSIEVEANLSHIHDGTQKSVLWALNKEEWLSGKVGTSSMVDAAEEFGEGFAEMGKSGSLGTKGAKAGYIRFLREWREENPDLKCFDALLTTVRNCGSRSDMDSKEIKSGVGIRVIFLKYLQFEQWGVAPWYLMPSAEGGSYEVLDLLTKFRSPSDVQRSLDLYPVHFRNSEDLQFFQQCLALNNYYRPVGTGSEKSDILESSWKILSGGSRQELNPLKIVPSKQGLPFEDAYSRIEEIDAASKVIYLPLTAQALPYQDILNHEGWTLTAFIPGKTAGTSSVPFSGMWMKLSSQQPLVTPAYLPSGDDLSPPWYFQKVSAIMAALDHNR